MEITREEIIELWLIPNFGLTVKELIEKEPEELLSSPDWFKKYAVSQQAHDEWHEKAINLIAKRLRMSKRLARRRFAFDYLNSAPSVK
jgi:hypothetical protein